MKVLLSDVFPKEQWSQTYSARVELFTLFSGFSDAVGDGVGINDRAC